MYGQCITPVSKCCCSGTPYANAEQHGIIMPDNVTTTVDKHGVLHAFPASNAYSRLENVRPYLYEVWYDKLDYDAAYAWFSTKQPPVAAGACSSFRIGNTFARNFDWLYDRGAEFVVHTRCKDGRFATTGVASALPGMFDEVARDRMRTALFSYLPFTIVDGFNEAGVYISTNIVPNEKGNNNYVTPTGESLTTICTAMLPRFILDSFDSAQSAADWLGEHATMFPSKTLLAKGYHQHFLLADAEDTLVLEFVDGALVVMDAPGETVKGITNFHVSGVTFNADGKVYTPGDVPTHTPTTENGLTPHGMGLERWNIMAGFTGTDARDLLDALRYTKAYPTATASAIPAWLTEFVDGNRTVDSPASDFAHVLQVAGELYTNRKRDGQTWQTVHASVYDMENQLLHLQVQEDDTTTYTFGLEGVCVSGGSGGCGCTDEYCAIFQDAYEQGCDSTMPYQYGSLKFTAAAAADSVNFFRYPRQIEFPDADLFEVYINGTLTDQSLYALTFAEGDHVEVKAKNSCVWFPAFWPGYIYLSPPSGEESYLNALDVLYSIDAPLPKLCLAKDYPLDTLGYYTSADGSESDVSMFGECTLLTSIPLGLFINCSNVTLAEDTFYYCLALTSVPSDLFAPCNLIISFQGVFSESGLASIPASLFANNTMATDFSGAFRDTAIENVDGAIFPASATSLSNCFARCTQLVSVSSDVFSHCTQVSNFQYCFARCTALSYIGSDLFATNKAFVLNLSNCFENDTTLSFDIRFTEHTRLDVYLSDFVTPVTGISRIVRVPDNNSDLLTRMFNNVATAYNLTVIKE